MPKASIFDMILWRLVQSNSAVAAEEGIMAGHPNHRYPLFVALALASAFSGLAADTNAQELPVSARETLPKEEIEDLQWFADHEKTSLEHQIEIRAWKTPVLDALEALAAKYPSDYAGAALETGANRRVMIAFRSAAPADVYRDSRLLDVSLEVREGVGYSEIERYEQLRQAHYALLNTHLYGDRISSSLNPWNGKIEIAIERPDQLIVDGRRLENPTFGELEATLPVEVTASFIDVAFVDSVRFESAAVPYGGARIEFQGGSLKCTAGFKATTGSVTGFMTAGHCIDEPSPNYWHDNDNGDGRWAISVRASTIGTDGDLGWYTTLGAEQDEFYHTFGQLRDPATVNTPTVGADTCKFGRVGGKWCSDMYRVNTCQGILCHLTVNIDSDVADGDSGGPNYWSTRIYGITYGRVYVLPSLWVVRDAFTEAVWSDEALGIRPSTS